MSHPGTSQHRQSHPFLTAFPAPPGWRARHGGGGTSDTSGHTRFTLVFTWSGDVQRAVSWCTQLNGDAVLPMEAAVALSTRDTSPGVGGARVMMAMRASGACAATHVPVIKAAAGADEHFVKRPLAFVFPHLLLRPWRGASSPQYRDRRRGAVLRRVGARGFTHPGRPPRAHCGARRCAPRCTGRCL